MSGLSVFENPDFGTKSMTDAISMYPPIYGRVGAMGIFGDERGIPDRKVTVEYKNGVINLLVSKVEGAPADVAKTDKRHLRTFTAPHFPYEDSILAASLQSVRKFGTVNEREAVAEVVAQKLADMRKPHDITKEFLRVGALKGLILDGDGSTVIANLFTEFGITQMIEYFDLSNASSNVRKHCLDVVRHIEDALKGDVMTRVHCLCGSNFFDAFTEHAKVKEAYARWQYGEALRGDFRSGFLFGDITFEEYRASATTKAGSTVKFIADDDAWFFPVGTVDTFRHWNAPANFVEAVNTLGLPYYAKQERMKFDRGIDIYTESNPLPMCLRPDVLVKGGIGAAP